MGVAMIAEGILNVYFFVFVKTILHGDAVAMGWITSAQAIGGLLGGMLLGHAGRRVGPVRLVGMGAIALGSIDLIMFNSRSLPVALVLVAIAGIAVVALFVSLQTLLQAAVPDRYRGRILGAFGTTTALLLLAGRGAAALVDDALGPTVMLNSVGLLDIAAGVIALLLLPGSAASPWGAAPIETTPDTLG
jgi:MFS family permease